MYLSSNAFHFHSFTHKFPFSGPLFPLPWVTMSPHCQCYAHHWCQHNAYSTLQKLFRIPEYHDSVGIRTRRWQFLHTWLYQNRNNQLNAESHLPLPWEPSCKKFSQWCCPTLKWLLSWAPTQTFQQKSLVKHRPYHILRLWPMVWNPK